MTYVFRVILLIYSVSLIALSGYVILTLGFKSDILPFLSGELPSTNLAYQEVKLHTLISSAAIFGSTLMTYYYATYSQNKLNRNLTVVYIFYPIVAMVIANIGYLVLRAFFVLGGSSNVNELGVIVTGFFVGFFIEKFISVVKHIFEILMSERSPEWRLVY